MGGSENCLPHRRLWICAEHRRNISRAVQDAHDHHHVGIRFEEDDVVAVGAGADAVAQLGPKIQERFPQSVFFGGRLVFPQDSLVSRWLHNYVIFSVQKNFYYQGIPFFVVPIRM